MALVFTMKRMPPEHMLLRKTAHVHACGCTVCASECLVVLPPHTLDGACMRWQAGLTSGFHEGLSRLRAAKYSTEGIRGNLLIREKRLNLRSCNCKWRWGLSEGLSVSPQEEYKQASSGSLTHTHTRIRHSHKHTCGHANTSSHENTHTHTPTHTHTQDPALFY